MRFNLKKSEKGNVLFIVVFIMTALFGVSALVVDVGMLYVEKRAMVTAADAAVLAGSRELALTGNTAAAIEVARNYAQANGATLTDEIYVESITHNNQPFQALVAHVGVNKEYLFARLLGLTDQNVMARAVAAWGHPTSYQNVLPIFYILEEGDDLPQGQVLLLIREDDYASGNWGFLRADSPGKKVVKDILAGAESNMYFQIGDDITNATETGRVAANINSVETRMQAAKNPDSGVSMEGVIPIIREITGQGHTQVIIVGFAPYEILDIITQVTKEEDNLWYGRGSVYAHFLDAPRLYSVFEEGYEKKQDADKDYPKGTIVGRFLTEKFIPSRYFIEISQNPDYDYGICVVKLIQ
jgi:hypothetical protein